MGGGPQSKLILYMPPLPARPIRQESKLCLDLVLVSLEVKPEVRLSMGSQDYVATWKARESNSPKE